MDSEKTATGAAGNGGGKRDELLSFTLIAVFLGPAVTVVVAGGWGFLIWMQQLIFGPPAS